MTFIFHHTALAQSSSIGGERVKEFEFNPRIHSDNPTEEASFFVHPKSKKLSICNAYNVQLSEPKPKKAICNVHCGNFYFFIYSIFETKILIFDHFKMKEKNSK
jgi:hypothetical protein